MSKFMIVRMEGMKAIPLNVHNPYVPTNEDYPITELDSAESAERWVKHLNAYNNVKCQIRPIKGDENWRERELKRIKDGVYKPVPWHNEAWVKECKDTLEHFLHVSEEDTTRVAYTESDAKGQRDLRTRIAPSKYLKRHYSGLISVDEIRRWCATYKNLYGTEYELKFAYGPDDIVRVYRNGPSSCMQGVESVRAYSGPDLAVAYLERKENITARVVVWPEKKLYCENIYGDYDMMAEVLEDEGYASSYRFKGARLTYIKDDKKLGYYDGVVLPSVECAECGLDTKSLAPDYVLIK